MPHLIYLHGFLSAPQSAKALQTQAKLAQLRPNWHFHCPALSAYPNEAFLQIQTLIQSLQPQPIALIGSSLGGFWATYFAKHYHLPAVLVNPAVAPHLRFGHWLGKPLKSYYGEAVYTLQPYHLSFLAEKDCPQPDMQRLWLMVQTGDETLNYRDALARYPDAQLTLEAGGNHSFEGFERWLPHIFDFFSGHFSAQPPLTFE